MKCVSKCLERILSEHDNIVVPSSSELFEAMNMSLKFKIANQLSELIRDIGYKNDIGYQSFLYGNQHEIRRLLLFLIERIPREDDSNSKELLDSDSDSKTCRTLRALRKRGLGTVWIPHDSQSRNLNYFHQNNRNHERLNEVGEDLEFDLSKFFNKSQPKPLQRVSKASLSSSDKQFLLPINVFDILEYNSRIQNKNMNNENSSFENIPSQNCLLFQASNIKNSEEFKKDSTDVEQESSIVEESEQKLNNSEKIERNEEFYLSEIENYRKELKNLNENILFYDENLKQFNVFELVYAEKCKLYEANCKSNQEVSFYY